MFAPFAYYIPTRILFGAGALNKLADATLPGKHALIVIGGKSVKKFGYLSRVESILDKAGVAHTLFDEVQPNPTLEGVRKASGIARANGCDFVLGLGGGSAMDSAKAISIMATNSGDLWDYIQGGSGKGQPIPVKPLPIVCITTTAGTGTEADPWFVISHEEKKEKIGFGSPDMFPTLSVVDPELMESVPPNLTAYQGFDALFHSIEGYTSKLAEPVSDMYALQSIEFLAKWLPTAVKDGKNIEARAYVALANTLAGFVESLSCCTSEHSIEHAMSAHHTALPHGAGLIAISEAYHETYAPACPQRYARMAEIMGGEASVKGFLSALVNLQRECGVDKLKLSDYGLSKAEIPAYIKTTRETMGALFDVSDIPDLTDAQVADILEKSIR